MGKKQDEIPKVTGSNTKKEILDAFNQIKEQLESQAEGELRPETEKESRRKKEVTSLADDLSVTKISSSIDGLKGEINNWLTQIAVEMEEAVGKYIKIKEAINDREKELEDLFGIEQSAYTLASLLETQKQKRNQFEEEMTQKRKELEEEINRSKALRDQEETGTGGVRIQFET